MVGGGGWCGGRVHSSKNWPRAARCDRSGPFFSFFFPSVDVCFHLRFPVSGDGGRGAAINTPEDTCRRSRSTPLPSTVGHRAADSGLGWWLSAAAVVVHRRAAPSPPCVPPPGSRNGGNGLGQWEPAFDCCRAPSANPHPPLPFSSPIARPRHLPPTQPPRSPPAAPSLTDPERQGVRPQRWSPRLAARGGARRLAPRCTPPPLIGRKPRATTCRLRAGGQRRSTAPRSGLPSVAVAPTVAPAAAARVGRHRRRRGAAGLAARGRAPPQRRARLGAAAASTAADGRGRVLGV